MQIYLFGCKDTSLHISRFFADNNVKVNLVTISPSMGKKHSVAGYTDLTSYCELFETIYVAESYSLKNQNDINYFQHNPKASIGFCIGWQRLIPGAILNAITHGVYGMHGSARDLPYGKGRSPMNWALIEGRSCFHTNLFKYEVGVDNGPIVDKRTFSINHFDNAETLHYKNTLAMCDLVLANLADLVHQRRQLTKQDTSLGETFYPKRAPDDGAIDWNDDIYNIERLIRAVSPPFFGAFTEKSKIRLKIYRANIFYTDIENHPYLTAAHGTVLEVMPNRKFLIKCSGGVLLVHEYEGKVPSKGTIMESAKPMRKKFSVNEYGFFDLQKLDK
jgi:methionyl-tRNA formyltransferase